MILESLDWQWLFWLSALLSIASIVLIALVVPRHSPAQSGRFDLTGAVLLAIGLSAVLVALSQGNLWGWASPATLIAAAVGIVVLLAWGRQQLSTTDPIVDLRATASAPLLFTNLASLVLGVLMFANLLLTTQVLQGATSEGGFGWSSSAAGLAMLPNAGVMLAVAPLTAWLATRWGPRTVLAVGGVVIADGYFLRIVASTSGTMVIVWATIVGVGVGIGYAALPMLIVRYAPGPQIGEANGVNALVRAIGTAIASAGVAAIGSILAVTVGGVPMYSAAAFTTISVIAGIGGLATVVCAALARGQVHLQ
ncbi:MFS transporter [Gordonia aichiensis]|uniref:MFS transporter n=1 Tax=Gordonia aichiensis TaxID=36820 RepID=UPI00326545E5